MTIHQAKKSMTEFVINKQNETKSSTSSNAETSCITKRLDEKSSKLSNVLTKSDTDIIKNIIKETLEEIKEKLLASVIKQLEIIESNMFDQQKEILTLKEQLNFKRKRN